MTEPAARSGPSIAISRAALQNNVYALRHRLPTKAVLAPIIKANAYGHGRRTVLKALEPEVDAFCLAEPDDALEVAGLTPAKIICLGPTYGEQLRALVQAGVEVAVSDKSVIGDLRVGDRVHVAVDTGLSRLGVHPADAEDLANSVRAAGAVIAGVFCHVAGADRGDWSDVEQEVRVLKSLRVGDSPRHFGGSTLSILRPDLVGDIARPGLATLGYYPQPYMRQEIELVPSLTLSAPVLETRTVAKGHRIGYSGIAVDGETVVATLGIGVHHGLDPNWGSSGGYVIIAGVRCPLIGDPMLDYTLVNAAWLPTVRRGDTATVIGPGVEIAVMASLLGDSEEHLLVRMNSEIPRRLVA